MPDSLWGMSRSIEAFKVFIASPGGLEAERIGVRDEIRSFTDSFMHEYGVSPDKIKIPACKSCNGTYLSRIEKNISKAFQVGPAALAALPERTLRIWFAKIAYGTRRNDMRLQNNRRDLGSPMIATTADLEELKLLHLLLHEARDVVHITEDHSTFFIFRSQCVGCNICDFDTALPIGWPNLAMLRLGSVTIMGAVDDRGALQMLRSHPVFQAANNMALHPIQVRALWALLVYQATLLCPDRLPLRFGVSQGQLWVDRLPPVADVFDQTQETTSAGKLLQHLIDASEEVLAAHGGPVGLLVNADGKPREISFEHGGLRLGL